MTTDSSKWAEFVSTLAKDGPFQVEIAQLRAKALLTEITGQAPAYRWTYVPSRVARNAAAALFDLENLSLTSPASVAVIGDAARRFAQVWESLAKLGEKASRETALINAAVAYEMAGYQANAACIARHIRRDRDQADVPTIVEIAAAFLQRLFLQVVHLAGLVRREPQVNAHLDRGIWEAAAVALASDGFSYAARYFLAGNEQELKESHRLFEESERFLAMLGLVAETNLVRSLRSLLPLMRDRSTWTVLKDLVANAPRWRRYLKLLARGAGSDVFRSPSVSELWPSQMEALNNGLLSSPKSKVVRMPTSAGKTRVAELAIVHTLVTQPGAKCIYVAPYRALVWELESAFLNLFGDLGFRVSSVIGTYESDDFEQLLVGDADILVITPEKLDLLQRLRPEFLENVRLIILDEGQIVHDRHRGAKFELLLTRLKRRLSGARFLSLSAVVPQETLEDFALWFNAHPQDDVVVSGWRPSIQRFARFEWAGNIGVIRYSPTEDIQLLREFVPGVISQRTYEFTNPDTGRINRRRFPDLNNKAQTASELAFRLARLGPVLVFCAQTNFADAVAKALQSRLNLALLSSEEIPAYFRTEGTRAALTAREWLGSEHMIAEMLSRGIAIHHGDIPEAVRKAVELDFRERKYRIVVATNTLAQGVNLPIRTVVVHSCWRGSADGTRERISARDYWNIAGRAGRAGEETEGTIIHISSSPGDERDFEYYLNNRLNAEYVESALFQMLRDLVQGRLTETALGEALDPEILALLVEESAKAIPEEAIEEIVNDSLVSIQARRHQIDLQPLRQVFRATAGGIVQQLPDTSYWSLYSSTGLSTTSCKRLRAHIIGHEDILRGLLEKASTEQLDELIATLLEGCLPLPEMQSDREFGGSYVELLGRWISGAAIPHIRAEFGAQAGTLEDLAKLIEDMFGFRLPWGISAYTRIATSTLGLDPAQLSAIARFFPTMVKFGVPNPVSAWAMAAGIPFRQTAMEIASAYLGGTDSPDYGSFLEWLGNLDAERLHYDFGLKSPVLEEVVRSLTRSGLNPLLKKFARTEEALPITLDVQGIAYEGRVAVALQARSGLLVTLVRDYDNPVDRNAVAVLLHRQKLGYLPRQFAQLIAPDMDSGLRLSAKIVSVTPGRIPRIRIRVELAS